MNKHLSELSACKQKLHWRDGYPKFAEWEDDLYRLERQVWNYSISFNQEVITTCEQANKLGREWVIQVTEE